MLIDSVDAETVKKRAESSEWRDGVVGGGCCKTSLDTVLIGLAAEKLNPNFAAMKVYSSNFHRCTAFITFVVVR